MLIEHDAEHERFLLKADGELCVLLYRQEADGVWDVFSVFVPPPMRGRGLGAELVKGATTLIRQAGHGVTLSCPFALRVMEERGVEMGRNERLLRKLGLIGVGDRNK